MRNKWKRKDIGSKIFGPIWIVLAISTLVFAACASQPGRAAPPAETEGETYIVVYMHEFEIIKDTDDGGPGDVVISTVAATGDRESTTHVQSLRLPAERFFEIGKEEELLEERYPHTGPSLPGTIDWANVIEDIEDGSLNPDDDLATLGTPWGIPVFALPEREMGDELRINISAIDIRRGDANHWKKVTDNVLQYVDQVVGFVVGYYTNPGTGEAAESATDETIQEIMSNFEQDEEQDLIGYADIRKSRADNWGARLASYKPGQAEIHNVEGAMDIGYSIHRVTVPNRFNIRVRLNSIERLSTGGTQEDRFQTFIRTRTFTRFSSSAVDEETCDDSHKKEKAGADLNTNCITDPDDTNDSLLGTPIEQSVELPDDPSREEASQIGLPVQDESGKVLMKRGDIWYLDRIIFDSRTSDLPGLFPFLFVEIGIWDWDDDGYLSHDPQGFITGLWLIGDIEHDTVQKDQPESGALQSLDIGEWSKHLNLKTALDDNDKKLSFEELARGRRPEQLQGSRRVRQGNDRYLITFEIELMPEVDVYYEPEGFNCADNEDKIVIPFEEGLDEDEVLQDQYLEDAHILWAERGYVGGVLVSYPETRVGRIGSGQRTAPVPGTDPEVSSRPHVAVVPSATTSMVFPHRAVSKVGASFGDGFEAASRTDQPRVEISAWSSKDGDERHDIATASRTIPSEHVEHFLGIGSPDDPILGLDIQFSGDPDGEWMYDNLQFCLGDPLSAEQQEFLLR